jgi:hypothetical protein
VDEQHGPQFVFRVVLVGGPALDANLLSPALERFGHQRVFRAEL